MSTKNRVRRGALTVTLLASMTAHAAPPPDPRADAEARAAKLVRAMRFDWPEHGVTVVTEVANTGKREGDEVAQLYLVPPAFEGAPRHALRGFQRVRLKAGERRRIAFTLSPRELSFVTRDGVRQLIPGRYSVVVGAGQPGTGVAGQAAALRLTKAVVPGR